MCAHSGGGVVALPNTQPRMREGRFTSVRPSVYLCHHALFHGGLATVHHGHQAVLLGEVAEARTRAKQSMANGKRVRSATLSFQKKNIRQPLPSLSRRDDRSRCAQRTRHRTE